MTNVQFCLLISEAPVQFNSMIVKPSFHMIAMIATIAAQGSQRSLRSLRAYGNIHSAIFAIVATVIAEIEIFLSLRSQSQSVCFHMLARIAAILVLRSLRSLRSYGN